MRNPRATFMNDLVSMVVEQTIRSERAYESFRDSSRNVSFLSPDRYGTGYRRL
jgi:hypothetical protein